MARILYNVAGVLVLVTGVLLVLRESDDGYEFSTTFETVGLAAVVVGAVLGRAVFGPGTRHLADAIRGGDAAEEKATRARLAGFGILDYAGAHRDHRRHGREVGSLTEAIGEPYVERTSTQVRQLVSHG